MRETLVEFDLCIAHNPTTLNFKKNICQTKYVYQYIYIFMYLYIVAIIY